MHGKQVRVKTDLCLLNFSVKILSVIKCVCVITGSIREEAAEEAMAVFDESQAEFRSILSFGVQEP